MEAIRDAKIKNASNRLRKLKKPPEEFKISEDHEEKLTELFRLFEADVEHGIGEGRISSKHIKVKTHYVLFVTSISFNNFFYFILYFYLKY